MSQIVLLSRDDQERTLRTIESAVHVRRRHQLFLWAQGPLFCLLPHEILICLRIERGNGASHVECLHGGILSDSTETALCHPQSGLAIRMARSCEQSGVLPTLVATDTGDHDRVYREFRGEMEGIGLRNALVHGNRFSRDQDASFFVMFNIEDQLAPVHKHLMQLLLPYMHMAFHHAISDELNPVSNNRESDSKPGITERELQILRWVGSGKSNSEIGSILDISVMTVKNHMKKIFKKLNVRNRAQAVSQALAHRMFHDGE